MARADVPERGLPETGHPETGLVSRNVPKATVRKLFPLLIATLMVTGCGMAGCGTGDCTIAAPPVDAKRLSWQPLPTLPALPVNPNYGTWIPPRGLHLGAAYDANGDRQRVLVTENRPGTLKLNPTQSGSSSSTVSTGLATIRDIRIAKLSTGSILVVVVGEVTTTPLKAGLRAYLADDELSGFDSSDLVVSIDDAMRSEVASSSWGRAELAGSTLYLFDTRNYRVLVVEDTNADAVPDSIASQVYVDSKMSHFLEEVRHLAWDSGTGLLCLRDDPRDEPRAEPYTEYWLRDTDLDGQADEYDAVSKSGNYLNEHDPELCAKVDAGDSSVTVLGPSGATIELWRMTSATGGYDTLLGTGTVPDQSNEVTITLPSPLAEGWYIRAKDTTHARESEVVEVLAARPHMTDVDLPSVVTHDGGTVTITGENIPSSISFEWDVDFELPTDAGPVTMVWKSSSEVQVSIPAWGSSADPLLGSLILTFTDGPTTIYIGIEMTSD